MDNDSKMHIISISWKTSTTIWDPSICLSQNTRGEEAALWGNMAPEPSVKAKQARQCLHHQRSHGKQRPVVAREVCSDEVEPRSSQDCAKRSNTYKLQPQKLQVDIWEKKIPSKGNHTLEEGPRKAGNFSIFGHIWNSNKKCLENMT